MSLASLAHEIFDEFNEDGDDWWAFSEAKAFARSAWGAELREQSFLQLLFLAVQSGYAEEDDTVHGIPRHLVVNLFLDGRCRGKLDHTLPGRIDVRSNHEAVFKKKGDLEGYIPTDPDALSAQEVSGLLGELQRAYAQEDFQRRLRQQRNSGNDTLTYYTYVRDLTAAIQAPIFARWGLPSPPSGVAVLRRLCLKYEKLGDTSVIRHSRACRELLGVDDVRSFNIHLSIEVPFFRQTEPGNCLQTNLRMVLKWFLPEKNYTMRNLDNLTGRSDRSKWTCTPQAMPALIAEGLDAQYYSAGPFHEILDGGKDFILDHYGKDIGNIFLETADFESVQNSIRMLSASKRYSLRKLSLREIENAIRMKQLLILLVDYNKLFEHSLLKNRAYNGHFITLTGAGPEHFQYHDSNGTPNRIVDKKRLWEAWDTPGTDNDAIVIKGKLGQLAKDDELLSIGFQNVGNGKT